MLSKYFLEQIKQNFPFEPTDDQEKALDAIADFLFNRDPDTLFLLKGYAGTGKSSLVGALVKTMTQLKQKAILLAPTGRAAKVFSSYSGQSAYTIHKKIYRQKTFSNEPMGFLLADNLHKHTLFIVDEASMISNDGLDSYSFGSGRLLDDLIQYVYNGEGCRLILMGDSAQLPPVSQADSPALDAETLRSYGLQVMGSALTQVVRQTEMSGILHNATLLRQAIDEDRVHDFPVIEYQAYPDIEIVTGTDLIEKIEDAYQRDGIEETLIITRSNKRANVFNNGIRNRILDREEILESGDLLLVAKNNYHWLKDETATDFIANGDIMEVRRVRKRYDMYGFSFADVLACFPDYNLEVELRILLDTLQAESPALKKEDNDRLFFAVLEDYEDLPTKRQRMKKIKEDPWYNAVQVKYGYALTCHKAQGGQWKSVFLDLSYVPPEYLGIDFYRWLYTAVTRSTSKLYLVNPVKKLLGET